VPRSSEPRESQAHGVSNYGFSQGQSENQGGHFQKGFVAESTGYFLMNFKVDSETLAASIKTGDIQDPLLPMQKALDMLAASKPEFDKMLKLAK
jgi:hypothetical protein